MEVTALIPMKGLRNAKQRLSPLLHAGEREQLAEVMFRDVLRQTVRAAGLVETVVVTGDDKVAQIASSLGAHVMRAQAGVAYDVAPVDEALLLGVVQCVQPRGDLGAAAHPGMKARIVVLLQVYFDRVTLGSARILTW